MISSLDKLKKELVKARTTNNENKRQIIRKKIENSSRKLYGYYNSKIHQNFWKTSGRIQKKFEYIYDDTGLGYNLNYGNNNKCSEKNSNKIKQTHFLEFDNLENNDVIITIEHCSNCLEHLSHTHHINDIYKKAANIIKNCISLRFPFIKIYLKPFEIKNDVKKLGCLEIQMAKKINDKTKIILIHSKINSGSWPNIYIILNKIMKHSPLLNLKITLYNKEEELNEKEKEREKLFENFGFPSKLSNIKINLYEYYPEQLEKYFFEYEDSLDQIFNPKRRTQILKEEKEKNKNKYLIKENLKRPKSNYSYNYSKNISERNFSNNKNINESNMSTIYSSKTNHNSLSNNSINKNDLYIHDSTQLKKMKGKFLSSAYSDEEGIVLIENVPYDSYIIETENCQYFSSCGIFLQFKKIFEYDELRNPYKNKLFTYNRIIGLFKQIDSYIQVFLYYINDDGRNELIEGAKVTLQRKFFGDNDFYNIDNEDFYFKENKNIKGRYDLITNPGECIINVFKVGFEKTSKEVNLEIGENKINIQLKN